MKREIKFRAWSEKDNKMFQWDDIKYLSDLGNVISGYPAFIPMQYTGLKDKNGKEIYEGDIIENNAVSFNTIEISRCCCWDEYVTGWYLGDSPLSETNKKHVIGNIYENPDLLTNK